MQSIGFALEYSLGHTTHAQNLKRVLQNDAYLRQSIAPTFVDLPFDGGGARWAKLPGVRSNWSVRASLGAYLGFRQAEKKQALNAALFHTQVTSLFSSGFMRRVPSVVSLDATPLQYDSLGEFYNHTPGSNQRLETFKKRMNERAFASAQRLITWSEWAKDSLVRDYGVTADKVTVIPPGVDTESWDVASRRTRAPGDPVHLLFVGGDWTRKGGEILTEAWRTLPPVVRANARLHLVTRDPKAGVALENTTVYTNISPNSPVLLDLFTQADVFVFPTYADCLPLAVLEASAASLPVITTDVGALPEAVTHEQTGLIIPTGNAAALAEAMVTLIQDGELRQRLGKAARETAMARFDASRNYRALLESVAHLAAGQRTT